MISLISKDFSFSSFFRFNLLAACLASSNIPAAICVTLTVEFAKALKSLNDKMNIVGFDFVEVNPKLDVGTNVTSYLGALTVAMFLGFIDEKKRLKLS